MLDRITEYTACVDAPHDWAVATIVSVRGSSPSPVGTSMAVSSDLRIIGSLSGGCMESSVAVAAQDAIADGIVRWESFGPPGTPAEEAGLGVALTCGGRIDVLIQPLASLGSDELAHLRELARRDPGAPASFSRVVPGPSGGEVPVDEYRGGAPLLFLSGVHDVSVHLARLALQAGWRVRMVDVRPAFAHADRVPHGVDLTVGDPATALGALISRDVMSDDLASARPWTAVCVMTHLTDLDVPVLDAALRDEGITFVGAMGSSRARSRRASDLRWLGHDDAAIEAIRSPLGLDIHARTAAETALSMFAELVAARNTTVPDDTPGTPLHSRSGPVNRDRPRTTSLIREKAV